MNTLDSKAQVRLVLTSVCGALTYLALYTLKVYTYSVHVQGLPLDKAWMKFISAVINVATASVLAPILYNGLHPALRAIGLAGTKGKNAPKERKVM